MWAKPRQPDLSRRFDGKINSWNTRYIHCEILQRIDSSLAVHRIVMLIRWQGLSTASVLPSASADSVQAFHDPHIIGPETLIAVKPLFVTDGLGRAGSFWPTVSSTQARDGDCG